MKEKKPINVEVGQNMKKCREEAGLTQEKFAEMLDLGVKHISAMECGAVGVSLPTLKKASEILSVSADALLFGKMDKTEELLRSAEVQILISRLLRLPRNKFDAVKDILDKVLAAMAVE